MKDEEKLYDYWLESQLKEARKSLGLGLDHDSEIDTTLLFNHLDKNDPKVIDRMISNTVDVGRATKAELIDMLGRTKKGTIITWKQGDETLYFFNTGKNSQNQHNIVALGKSMNHKDFDSLKKTFLKKILMKDIEKMNKKIIDEQLKQKKRSLVGKIMYNLNENDKKYEPTAFFFERDVIREIRAGNGTAKGIARSLISNMDKSERDKLSRMFINQGIKSPDAMERYLAMLQEKATKPVIEKKKTKVMVRER